MPDHSQPRRILVTGGAGFIGSHLVELLAARDDDIVVIDNLSTGRRENLCGVDPARLTFIDGTVGEALPELDPAEFDDIYHLAAAVGVRLVIERPIHTIETNVHETSAVLEFASARNTRLLIASTSEVYGKSTKTPFSEDDDVVYGPTIYSRWSYACSKAIDEYLAIAYHQQQGLPVTIVRFFNTVGPRQLGSYGMVLPRFVEAALKGEALEVHGDGLQTRCFCDVRDVVQVLPRVLENADCRGRVFNLGSDQSISIYELAEVVRETLNSDSQIVLVPYVQAFGEGFDDLRDRLPDLTRIRESVGFEPKYDLVQTIEDLAEVIRRDSTSMESLG